MDTFEDHPSAHPSPIFTNFRVSCIRCEYTTKCRMEHGDTRRDTARYGATHFEARGRFSVARFGANEIGTSLVFISMCSTRGGSAVVDNVDLPADSYRVYHRR